MAFLRSIRAAFRNYCQYRGRATRPEFWWFALFVLGVGAVLLALNLWFDGRSVQVGLTADSAFGYVSFSVLWGIIMLAPSLAVMVRRLHDAGRDSQALWILLPVVGWLIVAVNLCAPSKQNPIPASPRHPQPEKAADQISSSG